jgi:hypothetical protein
VRLKRSFGESQEERFTRRTGGAFRSAMRKAFWLKGRCIVPVLITANTFLRAAPKPMPKPAAAAIDNTIIEAGAMANGRSPK